jgi:hypothetical protein
MGIHRFRGISITIAIAIAIMAVDSTLFGVAVAAARTPALSIWLGIHLIIAIVGAAAFGAVAMKRRHRSRARRGEHRREVMRQLLEISASRQHSRT